jgi:tRNA(Ile2) C34 agmatinyltransferase TiaS
MLLSRVLRDAQSENEEEVSLLSAKGNYLELMNEGLIRNTIEISNVKDLMQNVRAEVVNLRPLQDAVGGIRSDITSLKTSLKKLETNLSRNVLCPACGKNVQSDFRICPYCGEDLLREKILLAEAEAIKARR